MDDANSFIAAIEAAVPEPPSDRETGGRALVLEHAKRMPPGYRAESATGLTFDPRLAFEIALRVDDPGEVFAKYGYNAEQAGALLANQVFQQCVRAYAAEVEKDGLTFKTKARLQAEDLLAHAYAIAINENVSPAVRADLIKWHAKVAGLEPKGDDSPAQSGSGFKLNIIFGEPGSPAKPVTIEGERA